MEVFFIISLITFAVVFFFKLLSESAYTSPPEEENTLRNMRDSTGHFYVSRFHAPNYHGGYWDATIMSHERAGYYTCVQGKTKIELEKNIDDTYRKLKEQWDKEDLLAFKKGINPYELYRKATETSTEGFTDSSDDLNSIEVTYSVFGYDELGDTTFDMDVKDSDYEWLEDAEDLDSAYISENRKGLHKRIIRAIRKNMKEGLFDPDDGMVEVYISGCHRKEYHEEASSEHAHDFANDDDIEYTVSL